MEPSASFFDRTALLTGPDVMQRLASTRVLLFGVGGVGSWCAEGLVRSGVGHLTLVDPDRVAPTNVNRQMMATSRTIGRLKVEALRDRLLEIHPAADIRCEARFFSEETAEDFDWDSYDYVIDAIDSLKDKAALILRACRSRAVFFSSMGAALKLDPTRVRVAEFWQVRGCPLGAALRKKYRQKGVLPARKFLCVYDDEVLPNRGRSDETCAYKAVINGSAAPVTALFGFTLASLVLQDVYRKGIG